MAEHTLVIGFGNLDRGDDGAAYHVVNALRARLGQTPLPEDTTGLESIGASVDSVFLVQLVPELLDVLAGYDRVVFVDAHVYEEGDAVRCAAVTAEHTTAFTTHHLSPAMLLALLEALYGRRPVAHLVSLRGYDFNFHRNLSPATHALVAEAADRILRLLTGAGD